MLVSVFYPLWAVLLAVGQQANPNKHLFNTPGIVFSGPNVIFKGSVKQPDKALFYTPALIGRGFQLAL
jgi:hypothetical protein